MEIMLVMFMEIVMMGMVNKDGNVTMLMTIIISLGMTPDLIGEETSS